MRISLKQVQNMPEFIDLPTEIQSLNNSRQILWHIENKIWEVPHCSECGQDVSWNHTTKEYRKYCSVVCSANSTDTIKKRNTTHLEKYGAHPMALTKTQQKRAKTLLANHGANYINIIASKRERTMKERYGVEYSFSSAEIRQKARSTMKNRYGAEYAMQVPELAKKHAETSLRQNGHRNPLSSDCVRQKRKATMMERYGTIHALQNNNIQECLRKTMKSRYGVEHRAQVHMSDDALRTLSSKEDLLRPIDDSNLTIVGDQLGVDPTTVSNYIRRHGIDFESQRVSLFENKIEDFLRLNQIAYEKNNRQAIRPFEIDYYLTDFNIGIECNGDYWHSDRFKDRNYHMNKWAMANTVGIRLLQISESDYSHKADQFHSVILAAIGRQLVGPGARHCRVSIINGSVSRQFLNSYHLQGAVTAPFHYGAFVDDALVAVMSLGWTRGSKKSRRFELKRWVTDGKIYPGLFSKTFKTAQEDIGFDEIVSFSMNSWFTGDVYEKCGFAWVGVTSPGYRYLWRGRLWHASNFTKSEIRKKFPETQKLFENGLTERQVTDKLGLPRVWDAGKTEWKWSK